MNDEVSGYCFVVHRSGALVTAMPSLSEILPGVIVPITVAAIVLLAGWQPWRRGADRGHWASAPAIAGGFAAGLPLILGAMPPFPPRDSTHWLMWYMPVVIAFGVADAIARPRALSRWPIGVIVSAGLFAVLLWTLIKIESARREAIL